MSSDYFSHGILTVVMITVCEFFFKYRGHLFASGNFFNHHILEKKLAKNYHKYREDTVTKIITTHIRNVIKTFIAIFMGITRGYIYHGHD